MADIIYTNENFDAISLHDSKVHGVQFCIDVAKFQSDIVFDIDYIVESACDSGFQFMVAPAELRFHNVTDLNLSINWGESGFQNSVSGPFIIELAREPAETKMRVKNYYLWKIVCNNEKYNISLGASDFTLTLLSDPVASSEQYLDIEERKALIK